MKKNKSTSSKPNKQELDKKHYNIHQLCKLSPDEANIEFRKFEYERESRNKLLLIVSSICMIMFLVSICIIVCYQNKNKYILVEIVKNEQSINDTQSSINSLYTDFNLESANYVLLKKIKKMKIKLEPLELIAIHNLNVEDLKNVYLADNDQRY